MHFSVTCPSCDSEFPIDSEKVPDGGVNAICSKCDGVFLVETPAETAGAPAQDEPLELETAEAPEPEGPPPSELEADSLDADALEVDAPEAETPEPEAPEADETAAAQEFDQFFEPVMSAGDDEVTQDGDTGDEGAVATVEESQDEAVEDEVDTEDEPVVEDAGFGLGGGEELAAVGEATEVEEPLADDSESDDPDAGSFAGLGTGVEEEAEEEAAAPAAPKFGQRDPHDKAKRLARVLVQDIIAYNQDLHSTAKANNSLKEDMEEEVAKSWEEYVDQVGAEIAESTTYFRDALNDILADGEEVFDGPP